MLIETKKKLKEDLINAELRAVTHFRKLNQIENIMRRAEVSKEMYYDTLQKIKEVIVG